MTSQKELKKIAIKIINAIETKRQKEVIRVEYGISNVYVWVHDTDESCYHLLVADFYSKKENYKKLKEIKEEIEKYR